MNLLRKLFGPKRPGLPPITYPVLGELRWDRDAEGWVGEVPVEGASIQIYLGSGSAHTPPRDELCSLLAQPIAHLSALARIARTYLLAQRPEASDAVTLTGVETFDHYLPDRTYELTFTRPGDDAIWRVTLEGEAPISCGVDD